MPVARVAGIFPRRENRGVNQLLPTVLVRDAMEVRYALAIRQLGGDAVLDVDGRASEVLWVELLRHPRVRAVASHLVRVLVNPLLVRHPIVYHPPSRHNHLWDERAVRSHDATREVAIVLRVLRAYHARIVRGVDGKPTRVANRVNPQQRLLAVHHLQKMASPRIAGLWVVLELHRLDILELDVLEMAVLPVRVVRGNLVPWHYLDVVEFIHSIA